MSNSQVRPNDPPDVVTAAVDRVRAQLAERRDRGELPSFPARELERQFDAIVEAVDANIVPPRPIDTSDLEELAELPNFSPSLREGGPARRLISLATRPLAVVVGWIVRRQVNVFTRRTAAVVAELARRQDRLQSFLSRAHLDRVRSLEYRVAQLEEELERTRRQDAVDS